MGSEPPPGRAVLVEPQLRGPEANRVAWLEQVLGDPSAVDELVSYDTGQTKSMRMGIYTAAIASIHKQ